jgi:pimeloyl-ACP methyl ester carboxylesterase
MRVAELIPQAELVLVPRGGHAYAQTEPDEFNRRVHDFFLSQAW